MKALFKKYIANKKTCSGNGGFTLIELLIAAVIILVSVVAVVSVVRKSTEMQINDNSRRQARTIIMKHFETDFRRYLNTRDYPIRGYSNTTLSRSVVDPSCVVPDCETIETVQLNRAEVGSDILTAITGQILFRVDSTTSDIGGVDVPVDSVTITVWWRDLPDTTRHEVTLTKLLAEVN